MTSLIGLTGKKYSGNAVRKRHAPSPSLLSRTNNVGFGEIAKEYKTKLTAKGDKERSIETAMGHVTKFGEWLSAKNLGLVDVRHKHVDEYIIHRQTLEGVGDITRRRDVIYIKAMVKFAVHRGHLNKNYIADYELPRFEKPYRKMPAVDELWRLFQAIVDKNRRDVNPCRRHRNEESEAFFSARDCCIVALGVSTSMRISEILSLTLANYDRKAQKIIVLKSKANEPREIPLEQDAIRFLESWLKVRPSEQLLRAVWSERGHEGEPTLFMADNGNQLVQNTWGRQFKRYLAWAGVEGMTFHNLRHYSGTNFARVDAVSAMDLMGHNSLKTTQIYTHSEEDAKRATVNTARPLGKILDCGNPKRRRSVIGM